LQNPVFERASAAKAELIRAGDKGAEEAARYLNSSVRMARIMAILIIKEVGNKEIAVKIVDSLDSREPSVRYHASIALREIFGQDFGFSHKAIKADRQTAVKKWREYFNSSAE
jgi:HEAT repeat protein